MLQLQLGDSCNCNGLRYLQAIGCEGAAEAVYRAIRLMALFSTHPYDSTNRDGKGDILVTLLRGNGIPAFADP
jgi:hypothetical protein